MKNKTALYRALTAAGMVASLCMFAPAYADEIADVGKLAKAGKVVEALSKANEYLAKHPADPQMRFMKGVLLTEQNKSEEAIAVFTKLTEDYKDLPEPYNNLAVLYAASGQYDKARIALEKAIRTNPSYMTAYENLGDVYGKMASQAYDKALALGANNTPSKSRLTLLRSFSSTTGVKGSVPELPPAAAPAPAPAAAPAPAPAPATQVAQAGRPAAPPLISQIPADSGKNTMLARIPALSVTPPPPAAAKPAPAPAPAPTPVPAPAATKPAVPVPLPVPVQTKPEPAKPAPAPVVAKPEPAKVEPPKPAKPEAPKPAKPDTTDRDAVLAQVNGWAKAWTAQNVDSYLGYYSRDFEPPKGMTHKAWAEERRSRIEGKGRIRVEVSSPEVVVTGNTAKVTFRQTYESDRLTARSRKVLVLTKNGGKWQIKQESSGS
ncbi:tetratricopeptide repeat protein [Pseudoduganella danionis]|uniref:Tetratricopeptide repeat protein n=1 Tax=Pseudoduganella danionis TaxID=1890295 RepID=A0ABW9SU47_9BURK|nr:tetratricopeptide repeat protein [Pseudoduganella danionis]MTW35557.1 tetratricopeptide repeat protein [Pseudoduganella danionis]